MSQLAYKFWQDESGATAIEYGLIGALISVALMAGAKPLGNALNDYFVYSGTKLNGVANNLN